MIWGNLHTTYPSRKKRNSGNNPTGPVRVATEAVAVQKDLKDFVPVLRFFGEQKVGPDDIFLGLFSRFSHKEIIKLGESFWGNICPNLFGWLDFNLFSENLVKKVGFSQPILNDFSELFFFIPHVILDNGTYRTQC